jgi:hypothetical protein
MLSFLSNVSRFSLERNSRGEPLLQIDMPEPPSARSWNWYLEKYFNLPDPGSMAASFLYFTSHLLLVCYVQGIFPSIRQFHDIQPSGHMDNVHYLRLSPSRVG